MSRLLAICLGVVLLLADTGCRRASTAPIVETRTAVVAGSPRAFPNPRLITHEGKTVRFYDDLVHGRVVMLNFAYTHCDGKCPKSAVQLVAAQRTLAERFGQSVTLLTLSLDPERDTPEAMRAYIEAHGGGPNWVWLTGRKDDIEAIRRFVGVVERDPVLDADRSRHTSLVLIGNDRAGRWSALSALVSPKQIVELVTRTAAERGR